MDMSKVREHLGLLGLRVRDRVTGFTGVVVTVGFDLYGCIQTVVNPSVGADGKPGESMWFDVGRLEVLHQTPVIEPPDYVSRAAGRPSGLPGG